MWGESSVNLTGEPGLGSQWWGSQPCLRSAPSLGLLLQELLPHDSELATQSWAGSWQLLGQVKKLGPYMKENSRG